MGGHREAEGHFRQRAAPKRCLEKGRNHKAFEQGEVVRAPGHGKLQTKLEATALSMCGRFI